MAASRFRFRVSFGWGLGFRAWGLGFGVEGLGFRVWGLGFGVRQGLCDFDLEGSLLTRGRT